jgi:hypothetical protein
VSIWWIFNPRYIGYMLSIFDLSLKNVIGSLSTIPSCMTQLLAIVAFYFLCLFLIYCGCFLHRMHVLVGYHLQWFSILLLVMFKRGTYIPLTSPTWILCGNLISDLYLSLIYRALSAQKPLGLCSSVLLYNLSSLPAAKPFLACNLHTTTNW